jgi:hypothetical protein
LLSGIIFGVLLVPVVLCYVNRNAATGLLVATTLAWVTIDGGAIHGTQGEPHYRHNFDIAGPGVVTAVQDNAWIFPVDAGDFATSNVHYLELGADIPEGLNVDVLRDISLFVYTGMRPNTFTMNFNSGEIVNGSFGMVGIHEHAGSELTADRPNTAAGGAAYVTVEDLRIFNAHPTDNVSMFGIGAEGEIVYTSITPNPVIAPATLDVSGIHFDYPIPGEINTPAFARGAAQLGTDIVGAAVPAAAWPSLGGGEWGWFAGQPCWPMTHRANDGAAGVVDILANVPDLPPFSYFEAHAEMSTESLINTDVGGAFEGRNQGLEFIDVMSANFTVDNGVFTDKYELGSRFRKRAPAQQRNVTGTLSLEFDDMRMYWKFFKGKKFSIMLRCISEDADRGSLVGCDEECPYSVCFYMRRCHFTGETPSASGPDMIVTDMPYRALVYRGVADSVTPYYDKAYTELAVWLTNLRSGQLWA